MENEPFLTLTESGREDEARNSERRTYPIVINTQAGHSLGDREGIDTLRALWDGGSELILRTIGTLWALGTIRSARRGSGLLSGHEVGPTIALRVAGDERQ